VSDQKITQLTEDTSPSATDLVVTVKDPSGTPTNKKVQIQNLLPATNFVQEHNTDGTHKVVTLTQQSSTPANPASGKVKFYADTSGNQYILDSSGNKFYIVSESLGGWIPANETWTYASADSPTFTFTVAGDKTSKYSAGMRIKLTQSGTVKYFIITAVSYSAPNTTITVYGGTDYTLANATISDNYYSFHKAPVGFPLDPSKWRVEFRDTSARSQSSPAIDTWYNLGSSSLTIPIGRWNLIYSVNFMFVCSSATNTWARTTLSTSSNSESDSDFTTFISGGNVSFLSTRIYGQKNISLTSKTTYYLLARQTTLGTVTEIIFEGNYGATIIRATCAYL
jgi:hypothetical protein